MKATGWTWAWARAAGPTRQTTAGQGAHAGGLRRGGPLPPGSPSSASARRRWPRRSRPTTPPPRARRPTAKKAGGDDHSGAIDSFPKISFDTLVNFEFAGFSAKDGPGEGPVPSLRFDSTFLLDINDKVSVDGLFQFKPRQPRAADDPNRDLFINQGAGRREGGKMKELYVRYGDYRIGKFVQDFGRAYSLLPGPYAADFIEEREQGYEPSDMLGVERIHVFKDENGGWRQLSVSAFMVDRTFLHESFPYNEGMVHYKDGGVGNTRWPENVMVTYDVLNKPIGNWGQLTYQASVIRYGRSYGAQRGEIWGTLGGDLAIPLHGSVANTLRGNYSQLRLYVEAARRDNFEGFAGRRARLRQRLGRVPHRSVGAGPDHDPTLDCRPHPAAAEGRDLHHHRGLQPAVADHGVGQRGRRVGQSSPGCLRRGEADPNRDQLQPFPGQGQRLLGGGH